MNITAVVAALLAAADLGERFFGAVTRVVEITPTRIDEYAQTRLDAGAARQTVNNELSALRRGFSLAVEKQVLSTAPVIKLPKVHNARSGFFEDGDLAAVLLELPVSIQPVVSLLRFTGWRVMEALGLRWDQVDRDRQGIRLEATATKGKEPRWFPFSVAPGLKALIDLQWRLWSGPYVFLQGGKPISYQSLLRAWKAAGKRAGCPDRLMHDLRRTAARGMRKNGVSEGVIMKLCGWKTRSMFDRYNIIDGADLEDAVEKCDGKVTAKSDLPSQIQPA